MPLSLAIVTGYIIFWNYDRIHDIINSNKTDNNKKVCFINGRGYKMAGLKKLPIAYPVGKGKPVYPSETLWKIPEYEYAPEFF